MKAPFGLPRLLGWTGRCVIALVALMVCASAFANSDKNVVTSRQKMLRAQSSRVVLTPRREVYILLTGSAIPQPIDRVAGLIATTTIPMTTIGNRTGQ